MTQLYSNKYLVAFISCIFKSPVMFHKMNVKNGSKDLKKYPQISRKIRDTLARFFLKIRLIKNRTCATNGAGGAPARRTAGAAGRQVNMSFVEQHHQHSDEQLLLPDNHAAVIHALLEPHSDTTQAPAQAHFLERICSLKLESYSHFPKDALREFIAELVTEVEVLSAPPTAQLFMLLGELGLMAAAEEDDEDASAVDTLLAWPPFRSKVCGPRPRSPLVCVHRFKFSGC